MVMTEMEKLLALCQQLQMGAKTPVQGKAATFQKVTILHLSVFLSLFLLVSALFIRKKKKANYLFLPEVCSVWWTLNKYITEIKQSR